MYLGTEHARPRSPATRPPIAGPLAGLANGTKYYWQVAARNEAGTTAGPVWSFTTVAANNNGGGGITIPPVDPGDDPVDPVDPDPPDATTIHGDTDVNGTVQVNEELPEEVLPQGCGAGGCGVGTTGMMPLMLFCLCGLKLRLPQRGKRTGRRHAQR